MSGQQGGAKSAADLVRGDGVDIGAALRATPRDPDERLYWDEIGDGGRDVYGTVEGVSTHQRCTTVYTDVGAFSVPEDFELRLVPVGQQEG